MKRLSNDGGMELVRPSAEYKHSFIAAMRELERENGAIEFDFAREADFDVYIRQLREQSEGKHLPPGFVPQTVLWLVDRGEYIGHVSIRHRLNDHLLQIGGHIGYDIRPGKRRQGYGTQILALALPHAKALGINRALLTCDETNAVSRRIIERNGGVLENQVPNPDGGPDKLRFWIDIR